MSEKDTSRVAELVHLVLVTKGSWAFPISAFRDKSMADRFLKRSREIKTDPGVKFEAYEIPLIDSGQDIEQMIVTVQRRAMALSGGIPQR